MGYDVGSFKMNCLKSFIDTNLYATTIWLNLFSHLLKSRVPTIGKSLEKVGNFVTAFLDREKVRKSDSID